MRKAHMAWGLLAGGVLLLSSLLAQPAEINNGVRIQDLSGRNQTERAVTISRFFAQGEIAEFAQAWVEGQQVPTQCDVKTRWPDGSLQHALVSLRVSLPASKSVTVTFTNQSSGQNEGALTSEQMLGGGYELGARMELQGNSLLTADIRQMIEAGAFSYWLQGPLCTQIIVEDRSPNQAFDLGWDEAKSFHPIFVATFYPGWRGVKVDLIGENVWINKVQDLRYSLALKVGWPLPDAPAYTTNNLVHSARTRWRKQFWSGPEPGAINIDYNLPYMIHSRVVPNFDLTKSVPNSAVSAEVAAFNRTDRGEINGVGQWQRAFGTTGGRPDIGLFPRWAVRYLYTFSPDLLKVVLANADVSGYIPIHYREGEVIRSFEGGEVDSAFGRVISTYGRPRFVSREIWDVNQFSAPADRPKLIGPMVRTAWSVDLAHQPSFTYIPYIVTGDWYYLEELYYWASFNLMNSTTGTCDYCRHDWGYINESSAQVRGEAWGLRTVAHAALLAPNGTQERAYFHEKVLDNIAVREGKMNVRDGVFYDSNRAPLWQWGRKIVQRDLDNPLSYLVRPQMTANVPATEPSIDKSKTFAVLGPWQQNFNYLVWGHMEELGFPTGPLRRTAMRHLLHQLQDPEYNPYLTGAYLLPVAPAQGVFFSSWAGTREGFSAGMRNTNYWTNGIGDAEHGYPYIAYAAASFLTDVRDGALQGANAWQWIQQNLPRPQVLDDNPKWALAPRQTGGVSEVAIASWAPRFRSWKKAPPQGRKKPVLALK